MPVFPYDTPQPALTALPETCAQMTVVMDLAESSQIVTKRTSARFLPGVLSHHSKLKP